MTTPSKWDQEPHTTKVQIILVYKLMVRILWTLSTRSLFGLQLLMPLCDFSSSLLGPHCSIWNHWSCSVNWLPWAEGGYLRFSMSWLRSYLSNRIFSVKIGNSLPCSAVVPQGSFLVPILFSLYMLSVASMIIFLLPSHSQQLHFWQ